ncbi:MAG TPA: nucleotidyl transferase AbiEii/AbiGii toxin family protein [Candidatus Nitrosotalea sp.]|nr:nucleotidyl transferase AbiEii/AbiGii toxin family protein [Candidatus Nitrosotalea sp.]
MLDRISRSPLARAFYLAGGTGLALQLGHRVSRDLDFFSLQATESVPTRRVLDQLGRIFLPAEYTVRLRERGQIDVAIKGVKVSFVAYPFSLEEAPVKQGPMKIAAARDIAAMKAFAIGRRAVSRDYVDLYYSLSRAMISMDDLCSKAERIFALEDGPVFDAWLFIKQLTYTDDLDDWRTVMDDVLDRELTWDAVREYLAEASVTWARAHVIGDGRDESEL